MTPPGPHTASATSFLPEDYLLNKAENRANFVSLVLFAIVLFGVVGAFFVTYRQWSTVKTQQADINRQYAAETKKIDQLKDLEAQKGEMLEKAEIATALIEKVPRSILMAELINRMPAKLTLTELAITSRRIGEDAKKVTSSANSPKSLAAKPAAATTGKKGAPPVKNEPPPRPRPPRMEFSMLITGLSLTDTDVADYQAALKDCPLLDRVDLVSTVETKVDETLVRKFRIEASLRNSADARSIAPLQVPRLKPASSVTVGANASDSSAPPPPPSANKPGALTEVDTGPHGRDPSDPPPSGNPR